MVRFEIWAQVSSSLQDLLNLLHKILVLQLIRASSHTMSSNHWLLPWPSADMTCNRITKMGQQTADDRRPQFADSLFSRSADVQQQRTRNPIGGRAVYRVPVFHQLMTSTTANSQTFNQCLPPLVHRFFFLSTVSRIRPPQSGIEFQKRNERPIWPDHFYHEVLLPASTLALVQFRAIYVVPSQFHWGRPPLLFFHVCTHIQTRTLDVFTRFNVCFRSFYKMLVVVIF